MGFQLWEVSTGNAIGEYDSEAAALSVVHATAQAHGSKS